MIKLKRHPINDIDRSWLEERRVEYREARRERDDRRTNALAKYYRKPRIKKALMRETHGKCAYCECKVGEASFGDVEHILPKKNDLERVLDFSNLTIACSKCNNAKLTYEDAAAALLNPYEDDPEVFLDAVGSLVLEVPALEGGGRNVKGEVTRLQLDLNRLDLILGRGQAIGICFQLLAKHDTAFDDVTRKVLRMNIVREIDDDAEYAFVRRHYVFRRLPGAKNELAQRQASR